MMMRDIQARTGLSATVVVLFVLLVCLMSPVVAHVANPDLTPELKPTQANDMFLSSLVLFAVYFLLGAAMLMMKEVRDSFGNKLVALVCVLALGAFSTMVSAVVMKEHLDDPAKKATYDKLVQASMGLLVAFAVALAGVASRNLGNAKALSSLTRASLASSSPLASWGFGKRR